MTAKTQTFKAMNIGVAETISAFAEEKNVPTLSFPKPPVATEKVETVRAEVAPRVRQESAEQGGPAPIHRLTAELPNYLAQAIQDRAHSNRTTIRFEVVDALRRAGFYVADVDLRKDMRGGR